MIEKTLKDYGYIAAAFVFISLIFLLMSTLISSPADLKRKISDVSMVDFIRIKRDENARLRERRAPDKPELEDRPPPPPDLAVEQDPVVLKPNLDIDLPDFDVPTDFSGAFLGQNANIGAGDSGLIPLVKVAARCPAVAIQTGKNGMVVLYLLVDATGKVQKAQVRKANPPGVFNSEALKAVRRWQFRPRVVDGTAVEQAGELEMEFICA